MTRWEYKHLMMMWMSEVLVLEDGSKLDWPDAWEHFSKLGSEGWELVIVTPVANQPIVSPTKDTPISKSLLTGLTGGIRSPGDTSVLLYVFKRAIN